MTSLILFIVGGSLNAVQDTLADHWEESIFKKWGWDKEFWHKASSWKRKYWLPSWIPDAWTDGWHIIKFLKLVCYGLAIVFYQPLIQIWILPVWSTDFIIIGMGRNLTMSLFYYKILRVKKEK
ncbi:hypothetical protein LCGC14_2769380 [marine sediment metagenome]|uniref:Uncharacterized protein n=1 Tax=marine sediment metagenome TaxID=412755 RepID=A0A0F8ZIE7_9ZZZZ